ncbi:MAG: hypothetical protein Ct9H300mP12_06730 [Acidimicrobiales bacterium]|nr:MAG: hypothetical protein Ct9H300mP12_06730 [Acidimicrobiales bacterium]
MLADVSAGDASTADAALTAAADAFEGWAALGPSGRAPYLRRLADLIDERVRTLPRWSASTWPCAMRASPTE